MTTQEQMFGVLIIVGVIFSILTNIALYYYGEYRTLRKKVDKGEYLYIRGEDWIERETHKELKKRMDTLEDRMSSLASKEFDNRVKTNNDIFIMRQEVDLIKFAKGINQDGFVDRVKNLEDKVLKNIYRLNKIESDEDIVRREFLFEKLRETDRRISKLQDRVEGKGVSDDSEKR